jgi:hypothetical protein
MPQTPGEQRFALPTLPKGARASDRPPLWRLLAAVGGGVFGALGASHHLPFLNHPGAFYLFMAGFLGALGLGNALFAAVAGPAGLAVVWAAFGGGRWVGSTVVRGRLVTFRLLPVIPFTACTVLVDVPGIRRRLWCGTAAAVGAELAAGGALVALGGPDVRAVGWGVLVMTVLASFANPATTGSRAWVLLKMPFRAEGLDELAHEPALVEVARALCAGRVRAARVALEAAGKPHTVVHLWATASVAAAEGRYAEAVDGAYALYEAAAVPRMRASALTAYARSLADGAVAGCWTREQMLPAFEATLAVLRAVRPAAVRHTDLGAIEALLHGDPARAVRLARAAASVAPDALSRARALRTLAAALTWSGSAPDAAKPLADAALLSPR